MREGAHDALRADFLLVNKKIKATKNFEHFVVNRLTIYLLTYMGVFAFMVRPGVCRDQGFDTHLTYVVQFV